MKKLENTDVVEETTVEKITEPKKKGKDVEKKKEKTTSEKVVEKMKEEIPKKKRKKRLKKNELYLEIGDTQFDLRKVEEEIREKHPNATELQIYVKPEDCMIYYVVDGIEEKIEMR